MPAENSELLVKYLMTESPDEALSVLARNPGLVTDTSVKVLDMLARSLPGDRELYQRNVRLLSRVNVVGL